MFETTRRIDFFEADAAGIMFFANVFKFAHAAYEEFLQSELPERNFFDHPEFLLPIIHSEADYHKVILPGEKIKIVLEVKQIRDSAFSLIYKMLGEEDDLRVKVNTVHVCVSKNGFKKVRLPEDLRNVLQKHREK